MTATMPAPGWSRGAYERARVLAEATPDGPLPPFVAHCSFCAFPTLRYRPVRAGRSWMGLCSHCGARTFAPLPKYLFAVTELLAPPASRGVDALGAFVAAIDHRGAAVEARARLEAVPFGARTRIQLSVPVACLACGQSGSAAARLDKNGAPYIASACCQTRTFLRAPAGLRMACGWTAWLQSAPGAQDAWMAAWRSGASTWRGWLSAGALAAPADTTAEDAHDLREAHE
jgi:hypothetical protein